jgi:hypothetical protein
MASLWLRAERHLEGERRARAEAAQAQLELAELKKIVTGLTPRQQADLERFREFVEHNPRVGKMSLPDAIVVFMRENPQLDLGRLADLTTTAELSLVPVLITAGEFSASAPNMIGD